MQTQDKNASKKNLKKLYVKTYGCQMNVYDSDRMAQLILKHGYEMVDSPDQANISLVNTCHIREKATEKTFSELGRLKKYKMKKIKAGEEGLLVVAGCVAQAEGEEIMRRAPYVDVVVGPQVYHRLPELIERAKRAAIPSGYQLAADRVIDIDFPLESKFDHLALPEANHSLSAFVSVQEGCDKFCTYCVVPYTRGAEYSRPVAEIVAESRHLVRQGVKEITLLGQNVNAYHGQSPSKKGIEWGLGELIFELAEIEDLDRIRYTTSHPRDMNKELIKAHGSCKKLMPFLHLPVQSGSDRILNIMNRQHTAGFYREIIAEILSQRSDMAFSSDFIVGFPGETEAEFEETMQLVRDINFAQAYSFKYSARPGTPAAVMDLQVPLKVQEERLERLQSLLNEQQIAFNNRLIGKTIDVLFEKQGTEPHQFIGKSPFMQSVYIDGRTKATSNFLPPYDIIGKVIPIKITEAGFKALKGIIE